MVKSLPSLQAWVAACAICYRVPLAWRSDPHPLHRPR